MAPRYHHAPTANAGPRSERNKELDGWKEIAFFLNRGIRTVQRWERAEGLPIHRHHHSKRGTVWAHATEIRAWVTARESRSVSVPMAGYSPMDNYGLNPRCLEAGQRAQEASERLHSAYARHSRQVTTLIAHVSRLLKDISSAA